MAIFYFIFSALTTFVPCIFCELIAMSHMDNLRGEGWDIISDNINNTRFVNSTLCPSGKCVYITKGVVLRKSFSTLNYENIEFIYDVNFGFQNELNHKGNVWDNAYIFYSCDDDITHEMKHFFGKNQHVNEKFLLPTKCNNIKNMVVYFAIWTKYNNQRIYIDNIRVSGNYNDKQFQKKNDNNTLENQILLFADDMSDYKLNWNKIHDKIETSMKSYCLHPPCIKLTGFGELRLKTGKINTRGYKNITLYYDLNLGPNEIYDSNDKFRLYFSCSGKDNPDILIKSYHGKNSLFYAGEMYQFPKECNDMVDSYMILELNNFATSEDTFVSNIKVYGMRMPSKYTKKQIDQREKLINSLTWSLILTILICGSIVIGLSYKIYQLKGFNKLYENSNKIVSLKLRPNERINESELRSISPKHSTNAFGFDGDSETV